VTAPTGARPLRLAEEHVIRDRLGWPTRPRRDRSRAGDQAWADRTRRRRRAHGRGDVGPGERGRAPEPGPAALLGPLPALHDGASGHGDSIRASRRTTDESG